MSAIVYSQLAEDDLIDIWVSIATDHVQNADRFLEELLADARQPGRAPRARLL
jgi:plasmid stabilization system protein ParE